MSLARFLIRPVTHLRAPLVAGRYGNEARDWSNAVETEAEAWIGQTSTITNERGAIVTITRLMLAAGFDVVEGDRFTLPNDTTGDVVGRPNRANTPRGEHHVEADVHVVEG